jgi:hypothetical protein
MMAQNDLVVVGIDVAKDKVDACIRRLSLRQTFPNTAQVIASWLLASRTPRGQGGDGGKWRLRA